MPGPTKRVKGLDVKLLLTNQTLYEPTRLKPTLWQRLTRGLKKVAIVHNTPKED